MKQYVIDEAYIDNYRVTTYDKGKRESTDIVAYYELSGYTARLESQGYNRAYNVAEYKEKLDEVEEQLRMAKEEYEMALANALII